MQPKKQRYLRDLRNNDELAGEPFVLADLSVRMALSGLPYLAFVLQDRSGRLAGYSDRIDGSLVAGLEVGAGVRVSGRAVQRDGRLQVAAEALAVCEIEDLSEYLPASPRPLDEMEAELRALAAGLREPLRGIVTDVLLAPDFLPAYLRAPAARRLHHACVGGLVEHTLAVTHLCEAFAEQYPAVDRDLLVAASLLHDLGKVDEYAPGKTIKHTMEGQLLGHIAMATTRVSEVINRRGDVPQGIRVRLLHAIIAHHGKLEYGSPVLPATLEATLLHQADLTDAQARGFIDQVAQDTRTGGPWTEYSRMFGTELLKPQAADEW